MVEVAGTVDVVVVVLVLDVELGVTETGATVVGLTNVVVPELGFEVELVVDVVDVVVVLVPLVPLGLVLVLVPVPAVLVLVLVLVDVLLLDP